MNTSDTHILVLEDDPNLGFLLRENLEMRGFRVTLCTDGVTGLEEYRQGEVNLCLVDIMMPRMDGFTFSREIRSGDIQTPIIFLTARSMKEDRIEGFRIGADDFVTKPFSMEELLLRIEAVLRRSQNQERAAADQSPDEFHLGEVEFHFARRELRVGDNRHTLTPKEAALLRLLLLRPGDVLTRTSALKEIWGNDTYYNSRSMDVFISRLRKYLKDSPEIEILTVHGQGFRLITKE